MLVILIIVVIRRSEVFEVFGVKVEVLDEFVHGEAHAKQRHGKAFEGLLKRYFG